MTGKLRVNDMEYSDRTIPRLAALLCAAALLTACGGSPAVRHYLIAPVAGTGTATSLPAGTVIGLGPVSVPDYLSRPQMALRTSVSTVEYRDGERWAEPFAENVRRVLKENLVAALAGATLRAYPWPRSEAVDYQVEVEITRFDAGASGTVVLEGQWSLQDGHGTVLRAGAPIAIPVTATDASPAALAAAHGAALDHLAKIIVTGLPNTSD